MMLALYISMALIGLQRIDQYWYVGRSIPRGLYNIYRASRNIAATLAIGMRNWGDKGAQTLYTARRS